MREIKACVCVPFFAGVPEETPDCGTPRRGMRAGEREKSGGGGTLSPPLPGGFGIGNHQIYTSDKSKVNCNQWINHNSATMYGVNASQNVFRFHDCWMLRRILLCFFYAFFCRRRLWFHERRRHPPSSNPSSFIFTPLSPRIQQKAQAFSSCIVRSPLSSRTWYTYTKN